MVHVAVGHGFSLRMQRRGYRVLQAGSCSPEGLFHFCGGSMSSDFIYASHEAAELREELRLLKEKHNNLLTGLEKLCASMSSIDSKSDSWSDGYNGALRQTKFELQKLLKKAKGK